MFPRIIKWLVHTLIGTRRYYYKKLSDAARTIHNKTILEIGSGKPVKGRYVYSAKHLFDPSNSFFLTDINASYGHNILDIVTMDLANEYDVILCLNVLEHVYETKIALRNLHRALKKNGVLFIAVPVHFPLHDEPHDYWRFTEHSLRKLLENFDDVRISPKGIRRFPFGYFVEAHKTKNEE